VGEIVRQTTFALSDVVDEGAKLGAAPTTGGRGAAGSAKGHLLSAFALEVDGGWMPLVDSSERHFAAFVVCIDAFEDLHHRLLSLSLSPAVLRFIGRAFVPGGTLVGWEANPSLVGRQVAVLRLHAALFWLRNDYTLLAERSKRNAQLQYLLHFSL
jgi:hypothetical protein